MLVKYNIRNSKKVIFLEKVVNEFALELSKKFDKDVVTKHFNRLDIGLLKLILSKMKVGRDDYLFSFEQVQELGFDIEHNESELFESLKKIASYYINVQNGYGDYHKVGLIENKFTIDQEMKILSVKIHKELVPFLSSLKDQYVPLIDVST